MRTRFPTRSPRVLASLAPAVRKVSIPFLSTKTAIMSPPCKNHLGLATTIWEPYGVDSENRERREQFLQEISLVPPVAEDADSFPHAVSKGLGKLGARGEESVHSLPVDQDGHNVPCFYCFVEGHVLERGIFFLKLGEGSDYPHIEVSHLALSQFFFASRA